MLVALSGCDSCNDPAPPAEPPSLPSASVAPSAAAPPASLPDEAAPPAPPKVTLLEAGKPPLRALRYSFQPTRRETVWMDVRLTMGVEVGAAKQPAADTPALRMALQLTPRAVSRDGTLEYDFKLESIEALQDPMIRQELLQAVREQTQGMVGLAGSAEVDRRGMTRSVTFAIPPGLVNPAAKGLLDNVRQSIRSITTVLPEEPVGTGARWELAAPVESATFQLTQLSTFTLKELKGDKASLQVEVRQHAPPQPIALPGMHPGAMAQLTQLTASGSGTVGLDLGRLVPESSLSLTSVMDLQVEEAGTRQPMKVTMRVQVGTTGKAPGR
jgi:hypothetical protein